MNNSICDFCGHRGGEWLHECEDFDLRYLVTGNGLLGYDPTLDSTKTAVREADSWRVVDGEHLGVTQHGEPVGELLRVHRFTGGWAACEPCHRRIAREDSAGLARRMMQVLHPEALEEAVILLMPAAHFFEHRSGRWHHSGS